MRRETLAELRTLADDCLCPTCLAGFADRDRHALGERAGHERARDRQHLGEGDPARRDSRARRAARLGTVRVRVPRRRAACSRSAIGPIAIGPGAIAESALSHLPWVHLHHLHSFEDAILWQVRAPRVVLAALVGGMLAIAGSAYQGVFRNPLADPYLLGVAAGAGLGATVAIAYAPPGSRAGELLPLSAFAGAILGVACAYLLGRSVGAVRTSGTLILAGVTVAAFMTAVQTFVQQQHAQTLRVGLLLAARWVRQRRLARRRPGRAVHRGERRGRCCCTGACSTCSASVTRRPASLGVNVRRVRLLIVIAATVGTAAAVAVSGLIGFVGIIVPHTIRLLVSTSYRAVVPLSLLVGRRLPRPRRRDRAHGALTSGASDRRRDRVLRRPLLRDRPAHDAEDGRMSVAAVEVQDLSVTLGRSQVVRELSATRRAGRVGRADRPERRRQDDHLARACRASSPSPGRFFWTVARSVRARAARSPARSRSCRRTRRRRRS